MRWFVLCVVGFIYTVILLLIIIWILLLLKYKKYPQSPSPSQALERSQSEGQALRAYIQYKLAPIVFEQVGALEMLLSAVEHFRSQMSAKVSQYVKTLDCKSLFRLLTEIDGV